MPLRPKTHSQLQRENSPFKEFYKKYEKEQDLKRGSAVERGYDSKWRKARAAYLIKHPLCAYCLKENRTTAAEVVDHIQAHKGNKVLFWDSNNWQSLCSICHNSIKRKEENRNKGYMG